MSRIETTEESELSEFENKISGPGEGLAQARKTRGLSQLDVAKRLHLTNKVVADIEANNFESGRSFTFIRGYLRSYARLVELAPEQVIQEFNALGLVEEQSERPSQPLSHRQRSYKDVGMRTVTISVSFLLLLLLMMWWHSQRNSDDVSPTIIPFNQAVTLQEVPPPAVVSEPAKPKLAETKAKPTAKRKQADATPEDFDNISQQLATQARDALKERAPDSLEQTQG